MSTRSPPNVVNKDELEPFEMVQGKFRMRGDDDEPDAQ